MTPCLPLLLALLTGQSDPPVSGDLANRESQPAPGVFPIPNGVVGSEHGIVTEATLRGITTRYRHREADGSHTEWSFGRGGRVSAITKCLETEWSRTTTVRGSDGSLGLAHKRFLANSWDARLELECGPAGTRLVARFTYWRVEGEELSVGVDSARGLVFGLGRHFDGDDIAAYQFGCYLRLVYLCQPVARHASEVWSGLSRFYHLVVPPDR